MSDPYVLLVTLLAAGMLLIGGEIFLPGGVLGLMAGGVLIGAVVVGFRINEAVGFYTLGGVVLLVAAATFAWVRYFPHTSLGRKMTLSVSERNMQSSENMESLVGQEGETLSDLRPAGYARIAGRKLDVVSEGGLVRSGQRVRVLLAAGNRVVVRETTGKGAA